MATVSNSDTQPDLTDTARNSPRDRRPAHPEPPAERVAAEAAAIYRDTFDTPPTPEQIAGEAYAIYVARGAEDGHDQDDWLEAERRLTARRQQV